MQPRISFWYIFSLFLFVPILLAGCGGGGGASSGGSLVYTGLTDPAQINSSNAEELATSAFEGGSFSNAGAVKNQTSASAEKAKSRNTFLLSIILKETSDLLDGKHGRASAAKAADGAIEGDNSCAEGPGKFEYILNYNIDYTAKGIFIYNGYCSRGTRLSGTVNVDLLYDSETLMLSSMTISFDSLSIQSGSMDLEAGGAIMYYNMLERSYNELINMVVRDRNTSKTYKTENLETVNSIGTDYIDVIVTCGTYYHPDHGYVSMGTLSPLRYYDNAELPVSGSFQVTGRSGAKALPGQYQVANGFPKSVVTGDFNNDGRVDVAVGTDTGMNIFLQENMHAPVMMGGLIWPARMTQLLRSGSRLIPESFQRRWLTQ